MIGVIADGADQEVVREFFELFKTPWEFYRKDRRYDALISAGDGQFDDTAQLVIVYAGRKVQVDGEDNCRSGNSRILLYQEARIPIYGDSVTFSRKGPAVLKDEDGQLCAAYVDRSRGRALARVGYDLFREVRTLLTSGQPAANADMPALELHISLLRDLITGCGIPLIEIPAVPDGYRFIACLTHDVDHPSIRQHKLDHTTLGFLYRAVFGSLRDLIRGRMSTRGLIANWAAVCKLPFVHVGLAKDFWREFDERYMEVEKELRSTFFVIPFKDRPGKTSCGAAPAFRASRYAARDIADSLQRLLAGGYEVGLHGIDAWADHSRGREELEEIRRLTHASEIGVRMHWLYYDRQSPVALEKAGASYDSTIGYNGTVGYRAGTTQAFKPFEASRLLELPLHAMDTALFYPAHLELSREEAKILLGRLVDNGIQFGGCLTVNWHDRSMAPERLWDACYRDLLQDLKDRGAWFATAGQAVSWFRKRRSVVFETDSNDPEGVRARVGADRGDSLPGLRLRIHKARASAGAGPFVDIGFDESVDTRVFCGVNE